MKNTEEIHLNSQNEWRKWLQENHLKKDAIWLIFYKQSSANFNFSWSAAVDEALCFGWIDSTKKTIDNERYKQYFSKRKPKSNWSRVNKNKVKSLIAQGLMKEAGSKSIAIAKKNGSWTFLDAIENLEIPIDLELELKKLPLAFNYFDALSKSTKKSLLYWVASAKKEETRIKRISEIVENASMQTKPKQFR